MAWPRSTSHTPISTNQREHRVKIAVLDGVRRRSSSSPEWAHWGACHHCPIHYRKGSWRLVAFATKSSPYLSSVRSARDSTWFLPTASTLRSSVKGLLSNWVERRSTWRISRDAQPKISQDLRETPRRSRWQRSMLNASHWAGHAQKQTAMIVPAKRSLVHLVLRWPASRPLSVCHRYCIYITSKSLVRIA